MPPTTLRVNGRSHTVDVDPATPLLYVLRNDLDLRGPRFGCGLGQCGACTVLINGEAVRSCVRAMSSVESAEITTLEGLAQDGRLHPLQQAWIDEQVPQCGFCQNGQILTAKALLDKNPRPSDAEIRQAMSRTLCRCMTYYRVQAAIKRAAGITNTAVAPATEVRHDAVHRRPAADRRGRAAAPGEPPPVPGPARVCSSSASRALPESLAFATQAAPGRRSVSRSRLPPARLVDRHPPRQLGHAVRRQDRPRPGHRHRVPPTARRRTRRRVRTDQRGDGQHRRHRRSGRVRRLRCLAGGRLADAARRRRSPARAARPGGGPARCAGRRARGERRRGQRARRLRPARHLRTS